MIILPTLLVRKEGYATSAALLEQLREHGAALLKATTIIEAFFMIGAGTRIKREAQKK